MLDFKKQADGIFKAEGYTLKYNPLDKTWLVKQGTKILASKVKGFALAQETANNHFKEFAPATKVIEAEIVAENKIAKKASIGKVYLDHANENEKKDTNTMATITKTKTAKTVPTAKAAAEITPAELTAKPAVKITTRKTAAPAKPKTPAAFPEFEKWLETSGVELKPVPKTGMKKAGIEAENKKTLQGAKLKFGRERAAYNRENGLTAEIVKPAASISAAEKEVPAKSKTVAAKIEKPTEPKTDGRATRHGDTFHKFGTVPTDLEYSIAQLDNARCSKAYNVIHCRKHPFSETAKNSYLANVERCYVSEEKVYNESLDAGTALPKNMYFEYFNKKGVPVELIREPKEGLSVLDGHTIEGFGRLKLGAGIKLPVVLRSVPAKK